MRIMRSSRAVCDAISFWLEYFRIRREDWEHASTIVGADATLGMFSFHDFRLESGNDREMFATGANKIQS